MGLFISKNKKWFGYLFFVLTMIMAILYYRFPSETLRDYFQARAARANPPLALSIENIKPWLPLGLKLAGTEVALKNRPDIPVFNADNLLLKLDLWSIFRGKSKFLFHCQAYRGNLIGSVHFSKDSTKRFIDTSIELRKIHIGDYVYLSDLIGRNLEGTLGGIISYTGRFNPLIDGAGKANLKLTQGRVELLQPILTLESIDFSEMEIEMSLNKRIINITRLELNGKQLNGTVSGTIALKEEFTKSSLDLKGTIEPSAAFFKGAPGISDAVALFTKRSNKSKFPFVIYGTLKEPKIKFT